MAISFKKFAIKAASNEGVDFPVFLNGKPAGNLKVVSAWSDKFIKARSESLRDGKSSDELKAMSNEERQSYLDEVRLTLLSSMVIGWDFEEEFTPENLREFLEGSPHIAEKVDEFTSNAGNFYRA